MIITISGKSASGKTDLADTLSRMGAKRIVTYTTRLPRNGETDGVDYHFISKEDFARLHTNGFFAETEEYSGGRFYGTAVRDIKEAYNSKDIYVAVLTPGGVRAFERALGARVVSVFIDVPDAIRVKRYIDRIGAEKMTSAELSECFERVQRDCGMFQGFADEVDMVYDNSTEYLGIPFKPNPIDTIAADVLSRARRLTRVRIGDKINQDEEEIEI